MGKSVDLIGQRFGRLVVIEKSENEIVVVMCFGYVSVIVEKIL